MAVSNLIMRLYMKSDKGVPIAEYRPTDNDESANSHLSELIRKMDPGDVLILEWVMPAVVRHQ